MPLVSAEIETLLKEAANEWVEDQAQRLGASLAFYTLLSLAPLLVVSVAVAALVYGEEAARGQLVWQLETLIGVNEAKGLQAFIEGAHKPAAGAFAAILSLVTLVISASSMVAELQDALNTIWRVAAGPKQSWRCFAIQFLRNRLHAIAIVLSGGIFLLASLAFSTWVAAVGKFLPSSRIPEAALHLASFVFSFVVITVIFAAIYKILPDLPLRWGDVIVGACVSSLLFTAGKQILALYLGKVSFDSVYGATGSLVVILVWVYYSAQLFFLGAEFTKVYARQHGSHVLGKPYSSTPAATRTEVPS
jgi:membrane protein